MNSFPDDPRLDERFRTLRCRDADSARGFVCILDLRRERGKNRSCPAGRLIAAAALLAMVVFCVLVRVPMKSAPPLILDAAAAQLINWESPTDFLLSDDFLPTPSN